MPPRRKTTPAQREQWAQQRQDKLAQLHTQLVEQVATLTDADAWKSWLSFASRFHGYSFNNLVLIQLQRPDATWVAGIKQWNSMGRRVRKGEHSIAILAPVTARVEGGEPEPTDAGEPDPPGAHIGPAGPAGGVSVTGAGATALVEAALARLDTPATRAGRVLRGFKVTTVWDIAQTEGDPIDPPARPGLSDVDAVLLSGQAPPGVWDALVGIAVEHGYRVERGDCDGANGYIRYVDQLIKVRDDVDDAQAVKTLTHDLLTAPTTWKTALRRHRGAFDAPVAACVHRATPALCSGRPSYRARRAGWYMEEQMQGSRLGRDVTRLAVPAVGGVVGVDGVVALLDAVGEPVVEASEFFASMLASGASRGSIRSYALSLLRWWRFLAAVDVPWTAATRIEARDFVLWMRLVGPAAPRRGRAGGYAPATINHALAVVKMFYADRIATGIGPLVNPVPDAQHRAGRKVQAHHNPMDEFKPGRRAPLRQKVPDRVPRSLPDHLFDALFAATRCDRDRALLAFYVSTGARASELLGVTVDRVDPGEQRIGVHRKGSGRLQWLPASADAFVWLRLYEQHARRTPGETALWLTRREPVRPLTYSAVRRMLQRANESLGTEWTLHDLRHTAAQRMIDDPSLSLTDVQWVLGHAHVTTTQLYLRPRPEEVVARVLEHHRTRKDRPILAPPAAGYSSDVLETLLGGGIGG